MIYKRLDAYNVYYGLDGGDRLNSYYLVMDYTIIIYFVLDDYRLLCEIYSIYIYIYILFYFFASSLHSC